MRGIASTSAGSTGVEITGIDTEKEQEMFTLSKRLIPGTGSYFGSDTKLNSAFIGEKLAKELNIIRYILTPEACTDPDIRRGSGGSGIEKLKPLEGQRFTTEKKFSEAYTGASFAEGDKEIRAS